MQERSGAQFLKEGSILLCGLFSAMSKGGAKRNRKETWYQYETQFDSDKGMGTRKELELSR